LYYPNRGELGSFKCSEIQICIANNKIRIFEDFIVFPITDHMNLIDITCNSQELDAKAEEFYANRKDEIDQQFLLFVENRNILEVDVRKLTQDLDLNYMKDFIQLNIENAKKITLWFEIGDGVNINGECLAK
jgi:hypothetical protein